MSSVEELRRGHGTFLLKTFFYFDFYFIDEVLKNVGPVMTRRTPKSCKVFVSEEDGVVWWEDSPGSIGNYRLNVHTWVSHTLYLCKK